MKQKKSKMYMLLASYALQDAKRVESRKNVRQQRFRHIRWRSCFDQSLGDPLFSIILFMIRSGDVINIAWYFTDRANEAEGRGSLKPDEILQD